MSRLLVLTIHLHDRYHGMAQGAPEWPPSPARVFQALVAGMARGTDLDPEAMDALAWLEGQAPPTIAAPPAKLGQEVCLFVPNNDADTLADPTDVGSLRTKKVVHPRLVEGGAPLHYAWMIDPHPDADRHAAVLLAGAERIYQLGRGVDQAWAHAVLMDTAGWEHLLGSYRGTVFHRTIGGEHRLACPVRGSLASLEARHHWHRLEQHGRVTLLRNAPKPRFVQVAYGVTPERLHFELRDALAPDTVLAWPMADVVRLVERIRDCAAARLQAALPADGAAIEATLIGNRPGTPSPQPLTTRARIVPIPSIGHEHADLAVRRITIEAPRTSHLLPPDLTWAFTGLRVHGATGADRDLLLVPADDTTMHDRYGAAARRWRSLTPLALPEAAARRRIDPARGRGEGKPASERGEEEDRACHAVATALRHAGVRAPLLEVRVQREPFHRRGARAEQFARGTRFAKERLWHAEIELATAVAGPLVLGDGRFLGLGVLEPVAPTDGVHAFRIAEPVPDHAIDPLVAAMRRAVLARAQEVQGQERLSTFFTGHASDGSAARSADANHIAVHWDAPRRLLLVLAPHCADRRAPRSAEVRDLACLDAAMTSLRELVAGRAGRHELTSVPIDADHPCFVAARVWQTISPYAVTRHPKRSTAEQAIVSDCLGECMRRGLPRPTVTVLSWRAVPFRGLVARLRLEFSAAVRGPLVLGRTRYRGGGLFAAAD
jgi:CRISPR-associated protein Csb2